MGFDKATLVVNGAPLATRVARVLAEVAGPLVEVGPGVAGIPTVTREDPPGEGPLAAVAAGAAVLAGLGRQGPALVLACDLPLVSSTLLSVLANHDAQGSVVPVLEGRDQPLCARWSWADLVAAGEAVAAGHHSMRSLLSRPGVVRLDASTWSRLVAPTELVDVDEPDDLARLGLSWCQSGASPCAGTPEGFRAARSTLA